MIPASNESEVLTDMLKIKKKDRPFSDVTFEDLFKQNYVLRCETDRMDCQKSRLSLKN